MDTEVAFFVYGLLMTGGPGFAALGMEGGVRRLGPDRVVGRLYHLGDYPGLVTGESGVVHGELIGIRDPLLLEKMDVYELYDPEKPGASEYRRVEVDLLDSGRRVWTYEYNRSVEGLPVIANGQWRNA
ncbi:gamma-glutamylcyclotransferase (GGCT)/AIG2-like uncharacterized protein YtfP [Sphingobium sp. B11D3B]|uniref:gamma-glutamylcyclotransferase family protein n=1 Tax=unclassified Sphingobium TaxID=2611147 RepID=UPI00222401FE|nr:MULTISPECIES: gamma-glutamylcyclotransferase family protein [unclassified Sphingobium]MCW2387973.1 gamma-glutamylcyclotransferase (GGCT)/AIG2-like uncharacterized protein YtfP [Sphingobium sp. B11D3B]MCW2412167.1 gamma-glutamylcyclotransferase (GGCT)/AIG2-like uncharacterized protein YtfP [Sphingobium sp. B8D3D]MCW2415536.1 gamma-glutamylcyclotransferase (GGCT)/AIG2-like uncharacterized protein YtfP [Sphingobium sp. B8D3A]